MRLYPQGAPDREVAGKRAVQAPAGTRPGKRNVHSLIDMETIRLEVCSQEFAALSAVAAAQLKNIGNIRSTQKPQL